MLPSPVGIRDSSPPRVKFPDRTKIIVVTADFTSDDTDSCAPVPSANIVSTAATPMVIPNTASPVRSLFLFNAFCAIRKPVVSIESLSLLHYSYFSEAIGSTCEACFAG